MYFNIKNGFNHIDTLLIKNSDHESHNGEGDNFHFSITNKKAIYIDLYILLISILLGHLSIRHQKP